MKATQTKAKTSDEINQLFNSYLSNYGNAVIDTPDGLRVEIGDVQDGNNASMQRIGSVVSHRDSPLYTRTYWSVAYSVRSVNMHQSTMLALETCINTRQMLHEMRTHVNAVLLAVLQGDSNFKTCLQSRLIVKVQDGMFRYEACEPRFHAPIAGVSIGITHAQQQPDAIGTLTRFLDRYMIPYDPNHIPALLGRVD